MRRIHSETRDKSLGFAVDAALEDAIEISPFKTVLNKLTACIYTFLL